MLCRVLKIGHSTKTFFAECCTRQRIALGKDFFAECRTLGKKGSRQKHGTRHRLPRVTVFGHVLLCRVPDPRQNLYTRHRLPVKRRPVTAFFAERLRLGTRQRFVFLFLISLPSAPDLALGKDVNFFLKKILCRAPDLRRSAKNLKKKLNLCRVPDLGHSANKFKKKSNLCQVPNCRRSAKKAVTERRFTGSLCRV